MRQESYCRAVVMASALAASVASGQDNSPLDPDGAAGNISSGEKENDPQQPVFELTYNRWLGKAGKANWGLEGAFNFMSLSIRDNSTLLGNVTVQTDAYALNGVIPPQPPYFGTYEGPVPGGPNRPVISDTPIPQAAVLLPNGAIITGERKIDADLYGFRIGPYLDFPLSEKLTLSLSGGFAVVSVQSKFKFNETVAIPNIAATAPATVPGGPAANSVTRAGSDSHSDFLLGGYGA